MLRLVSLYKGSVLRVLKGVYRGSIVGFYDIEALLVRIGFGGILFFSYNKEPPKPYFNY